MNATIQPQKSVSSPLQAMGGRFVLRLQLVSQLLSTAVGPILGIYFIYVTAGLTNNQIRLLMVSLVVCLVAVNTLHFLYAYYVTRQARAQLDHIFKGKPVSVENNESAAWKEIATFPRRSTAAQISLLVLLVIVPILLFMRSNAGVTSTQSVYLVIGGFLSALAVVTQDFLFLDTQLSPVRQALLPSDPSQREIKQTIGQRARQYIITSIMLLVSIIMVGGVSYHNVTALLAPGADSATIFSQFKTQLLITGLAIFSVGTFMASRIANSVSKPTDEVIHVMNQVKNGDFSNRARIMTSDDMALLTINFNQMVDQMQSTQLTLEGHVKDRTEILEKRGRQLQAAAQVAREATSAEDLNSMLSRTVNLISEQFGFYHAGIFLVDDAGDYAVLQAASSTGGKNMLARGHKLEVGQQGIVGAAVFQARPRIAMDVGADREFFNNPDLPTTRSEAAIPLIVREKVIGVLDIQSDEESKFLAGDIEVLQILADQLALAIQNARLIAESQDAIQRLEATTSVNIRRAWQGRLQTAKSAYRFTSSGLIPAAQLETQPVTDEEKKEYLKIPINLRGQRIGTISLHRKGEMEWSDSDRSLAQDISIQVGLALENARLVQDTQLRAEREQTISQVTARIRETLDIDAVLQTAVREIKQSFNLDQAEVRLEIAGQSTQNPQPRQP